MNYKQRYALGLLAEECSEVIQLIGKALRFGYDAPGGAGPPFYGRAARENIANELGDVLAAINFAIAHGLLDTEKISKARDNKIKKLFDKNSRDANGNRLAPEPEK